VWRSELLQERWCDQAREMVVLVNRGGSEKDVSRSSRGRVGSSVIITNGCCGRIGYALAPFTGLGINPLT
jgi:hypothetical protein